MILPSSVITPTDLSAEELEAYGIAGLLAMVPVEDTKPNPDPKPDKEVCTCNKSTGKISYDGGTSLTDCPCKNGTSKCGCVNSKKIGDAPVTDVQKERFPRTIFVTQPRTCVPCRKVDIEIISKLRDSNHKKSGWTVGKESFNVFQILDLDDPDSIVEIDRLELDLNSVPTFFFIEQDGKRKKFVGDMSYPKFIEWSSSKKK